MLTGLSVENLRVFTGGPWWFDLRPLTVFCGTNSSGKSTLLKALLALKQTQLEAEGLRSEEGVLQLSGADFDLGTYRSLASNNDMSAPLRLGVSFADSMPPEFAEVLTPKASRARGKSARRVEYLMDARFTFSAESAISRRAQGQGYLASADFRLASGSASADWHVTRAADPPGYVLDLPVRLARTAAARPGMYVLTRRGRREVRVQLSGLVPSYVRMILGGRHSQSRLIYGVPAHPLVFGANSDLVRALELVTYLGPLRAPAQRYYVASTDTPPTLDSRGEFLPFILRDRFHERVRYEKPRKSGLTDGTLGEALNDWLRYLRSGEVSGRTASEVRVRSRHDVLVEVELRGSQGKRLHGVVDSGFGYSQVLPILVKILLAPAGSTVLIEQPEVHLNPALQVRLAEFLAASIAARKQIILETHSEHIVNSLRALIAESRAELSNQLRIYYLEPGPGGLPAIHDLEVRADGTVPDWPRSFFGESLHLSSRLLAAQRRNIR